MLTKVDKTKKKKGLAFFKIVNHMVMSIHETKLAINARTVYVVLTKNNCC